MEIVYGKILTPDQEKVVWQIAKECDILFDTAKLLFYRNIDTVEKAKRFLSPGKYGFYNPNLLDGVKDACERIRTAKEQNQSVLVFGDYDADGVCATTVLYFALKEYGVSNLYKFVPEREQGYGLNVQTVERLNAQNKIDLLITVDCGISDYEKIEIIKKMGIDVIVTDHHEPPEILPDCIRINPKILGQAYPFNGLCGAGVAYKLAYALMGEKADAYLDFVALATVADSMDLVDENRDIVACGLKLFDNVNSLRLPFKYLLGENKNVTAQTLAYTIAPRINAGGRMGDANSALELFTQKDTNKVFDYAVKLNEYNVARQVACDEIYNQAKQRIKKYSLYKKDVILVKNKNWNAGFIGIVAAKLVEDYARPVIVFGGQDEFLKGSARSIDGLNIYDAIANSKDVLLGYGGHSQAAGVSVSDENFALFEKKINEYVKREYGTIDLKRKVYAEWDIKDGISSRFACELDMLEPFGTANKRPVFTTCVNSVNSIPLRQGSNHYTFNCNNIEMLDFNGGGHVEQLSLPVDKKVLFEINVSTFKGRQSIKGYVRAVYPDYADFSCVKLHVFENELKRLLTDDGINSALENATAVVDSIGTLYVLSDAENLSKFDSVKSLPISLFDVETKNGNSCVVISPRAIPDCFERVVYLDKPMQYLTCDVKSYLYSDVIGYKILDKISTYRSDFSRIFTCLKTLNNKAFNGSANFALRHAGSENKENFVFVTEVFLELNIFEIKNGTFVFNENIKNALTNSKLYSKIVLLKGQYV